MKKVLIFVIIINIILAATIFVPSIPVNNFYRANEFNTPSNTSREIDENLNVPSYMVDFNTVSESLQTDESKKALNEFSHVVMI